MGTKRVFSGRKRVKRGYHKGVLDIRGLSVGTTRVFCMEEG